MAARGLRVFGLARSVYTRIARLALEEKGADYVLEEVEIFGATGVPADHLARHPFGRIPVLQHDDFLLYETTAIGRYVDEVLPGPALQPAGARARARMNQLVALLDAYAYRPMVWGVFVERVLAPREGRTPDAAVISRALDAARRCLHEIDRLHERSAFLAGDVVTLADLHAFPMLRCLALAPEGDALIATVPRLREWLERMSARRSAARTKSPYEP